MSFVPAPIVRADQGVATVTIRDINVQPGEGKAPVAGKAVVQTSATSPEAPIRLRLVIGGETPDESVPEIRETSNTGSR